MSISLNRILFFPLVSFCFIANAQSIGNLLADESKISHWQVASFVSEEGVQAFCDQQCFSASLITDEIFNRMKGRSYPSNCTLSRENLRYLKVLHYTADGRIRLGEMIVNRAISKNLLDVFKILFENRYPIEKMVLIDNYGANDEKSMNDNNSSAFNFRFVQGTQVLSNHSYGMAVDINPLFNPYIVKTNKGTFVSPKTGMPYIDRKQKFVYKISADDLCVQEFKKRGFEWGGDWKTHKDYQHFEKTK